jgi:hypothetical protein
VPLSLPRRGGPLMAQKRLAALDRHDQAEALVAELAD